MAFGHPFVEAQIPIDAGLELSTVVDEDLETFVPEARADVLQQCEVVGCLGAVADEKLPCHRMPCAQVCFRIQARKTRLAGMGVAELSLEESAMRRPIVIPVAYGLDSPWLAASVQ